MQDLDDDLFGPSNSSYQNTPSSSKYRPPPIPAQIGRGRNDFDRSDARKWSSRGEEANSGSTSLLGNRGQKRDHDGSEKRAMTATPPSADAINVKKLEPLGETRRIMFQQPSQVCCLSRTADGKVHFDDRCLRRFRQEVLKEKGANLNEGLDTFVEKREGQDEPNPFIDLLSSIRSIKYPFQDPQFLPHFVTFRNNLNKILGTAYNRDEDWEMGVHKRGPTIYLDVHKSDPGRDYMRRENRRFTYYGYKYEKVATESRAPAQAGGREEPVDPNVEYCAVFKTKLGAHRILMGAEIDCYEKSEGNKRSYVELKTSVEVTNDKKRRIFESKKLLKFWIQSFLAGVPKVVVGFRDDTGHVVRSQSLTLKDMTDAAKKQAYWEGGACLSFGDMVLTWLYGSLPSDNEDCILRFVSAGNRLELLRANNAPQFLEEHCSLVRGYSS